MSSDDNKVVDIFKKKEEKAVETPEGAAKEPEKDEFQQIIERNKKNAERVAKERAGNNKSTLRSYRIKH